MAGRPELTRTWLNVDLSAQDPDFLFLAELAQITETERDEPIRTVLYRVAGPVLETADIAFDDQQFLRPVQTQFVLVERKDGMRYFERFKPERHGEWEQIQNTGMTPNACIADIYAHGEQYPAIIHEFINERKRHGGASKTHWSAGRHPDPRRR